MSVYQSLGYRAAFLIAAAFGVLTVLIIQFVGDKGEPAAAPAASGRERLQLIEPKAIPVALVIMLFAIPYCATQSFLVSYVEARGVNVSVSLFFPLYAAVLLVLRLSFRQWFDRLPFGVFLCAGAASAAVSILIAGRIAHQPAHGAGCRVYGRRLWDYVLGLPVLGHSAGRAWQARPGQQHLLCGAGSWYDAGAYPGR